MKQEEFINKMTPLIRAIKDLELELDVLKKEKHALILEKAVAETNIKVGDVVTWNKKKGRVVELIIADGFEEISNLVDEIRLNYRVVRILKGGHDGAREKVYSWENPVKIEGGAS